MFVGGRGWWVAVATVLLGTVVLAQFFPHKGGKDCVSPPVTGLCRAYFRKYYFSVVTGRCEKFVYGGCGGNNNRYDSLKECWRACGGHGSGWAPYYSRGG